jgi:hypothetical protein
MEAQIDFILKRNQLSVTGSRKKILELFLDSKGALAHGDIEKKTGEKFDRVTVYRTLQIFLEKGIIHNIPTATIPSATLCVKAIARRDIITIIMFTSFASHAAIPAAWPMLWFLLLNYQLVFSPQSTRWS